LEVLHGPMSPEMRSAAGQTVALQDQATYWATPREAMWRALGNERYITTKRGQGNLEDQSTVWQTPGTDSFRCRGGDRKDEQGLDQQARTWPTPSVMMTGERTSPETFARRQASLKAKHGSKTGNGAGPDLAMIAKTWPTPTTRDFKGTNSSEHVTTNSTGAMHMDQLPNFVEHGDHYARPLPTTLSGPTCLTPIPFSPLPSETSTNGPLLAELQAYRRWAERSGGAAGWRGTWTRRPRRVLNPWFVELLMRWPAGWTDYATLGTGLTLWLDATRSFISRLYSQRSASVRQGSLF
jgi:hypothetical protein